VTLRLVSPSREAEGLHRPRGQATGAAPLPCSGFATAPMPKGNRRAKQQQAGSHFASSSWLGRLTGEGQLQSNPPARGRAADWLAFASWLAEEILGRRRATAVGVLLRLASFERVLREAFGPQGSSCLIFSTGPFVQSCLTISGRVAFHIELASQLHFIGCFSRLRVATATRCARCSPDHSRPRRQASLWKSSTSSS
jgi:hypothetical protein